MSSDKLKSNHVHQPKQPPSRARGLWAFLTDPGPIYQNADERARAGLLASIQIVLIPVIVLGVIGALPIISQAPSLLKSTTFVLASSAIIVSLLTYGLNRAGKFKLAATLYTLLIFIIAPLMARTSETGQINIHISGLAIGGVILASILFSNPGYTVTAGFIVVGGTILIPLLTEVAEFKDVAAMFGVNFANSVLVVIYSLYRDQLDKKRQANLRSINAQLNDSYDATLAGWSRALEIKDPYTNGHAKRVADLTVKMAMASGFKGPDLVHIYRGAILHDIGKIGIPDNILLKEGKLTEDEMAIVRQHPDWGYEMLLPIPFLLPALYIPYSHHEKWDGSGYPQGLKGKEIPMEARIFCIVDVYDALLSDRPYRPAWQEKKVLEYIQAEAGAHFEPESVEVFFSIL